MLMYFAIMALLFSKSSQKKCFDTMCWSNNHTKNISCDHHDHHCQVDDSGNLKCEPGSTDHGIECDTVNKYYHCSCNQDSYGQASCDCMGALIFWVVIGIMGTMFLITQLWLMCNYCKTRQQYPRRTTIQAAVAEQENYGGTEDDGGNRPIAGGVRLFPPDVERLLPAEPGDSNFLGGSEYGGASAPPPSYNEVTAPGSGFYNPPVNPYYNQLT